VVAKSQVPWLTTSTSNAVALNTPQLNSTLAI